MYLLDTNVISELRKAKSHKANHAVISWAESVPSTQMYISSITVLEIETGILQMERKDTHQGKLLRHWFEEQVLPTFAGRIISVDTRVALQCAKLHVPDRRSDRDSLIAACALVHNFTVVTRNTRDFEQTGVRLLTPWDQ